jgi:putative transposase
LAVEKLYGNGELRLTYGSIRQAFPQLKSKANVAFRDFVQTHVSNKKTYGGGTCIGIADASSTSIFKWFKAYRSGGIAGLVDSRWKSGRKGSRLPPEAEALLQICVGEYLHPDSPTKRAIVANTIERFKRENRARNRDRQPQLPLPSKNTILARVEKFTPFEVTLHRKGEDAARKKFFPVGTGLQLGRPLERVEMDGWTVDLMTIAKSTRLLEKLAPALVEKIGLDGRKKRWHLIGAICCTTKCLVGVTLSKSENVSAAIDCLQMIMRDKGHHADAVGALSPWHMHGVPDLLVTDNGSAFANYRFIAAAQNVALDLTRAPAGLPQLRGTIERLFGTASTNLVSRLSGRTFSDVVERGDYPSEARAVNTVEEFATMLVRWTVDVYHNTPHEGLGGETPLECWKRLSNTYGVRPGPDLRTQRVAFGVDLERKIDKSGLTVLGVSYNSERLGRHFRQMGSCSLQVRWLPENIGAIEVLLEDSWVTVAAVLPDFQGRTARDWTLSKNLIRQGDPNAREISASIIAAAFEEIGRMNAAAGQRAGILSERWTEESIARFEQGLGIGFRAGSDVLQGEAADKYGTLIDVRTERKASNGTSANHGVSRSEAPKNDWKF